MMRKIGIKGQEEMVGFAIIMIVVAVIILIFVSIAFRKPAVEESFENYELDSFIIAMTGYTTDCALDSEPNYRTLSENIRDCREDKICLDGRESCEVLNQTVYEIMERNWPVSKESVEKGYLLEISSEGENLLNISKGNATRLFKGTSHPLNEIDIKVKIYL